MNKLRRTVAMMTMGIAMLWAGPAAAQPAKPGAAQIPPPAKRPERVEIARGPEVEIANDQFTIIRWTTNNPGGSDVHYGVVHYGTNPEKLNQKAQNPIRLNQNHPETTFRVQMRGLEPRTTYYYTVTSMESNGKSDEVKSAVQQFTTP